jgi:serine/threonine protein kinase
LLDEGIGTQNYMAPECEAGTEGAAGPAADIYSVGKLLWAALCNQNVFSRETPVFQSKSLVYMMPVNESAWHLHHVFEVMIRHEPTKRAIDASAAIVVCKNALRLIEGKYPPLEKLATGVCPHCGFGNMGHFDGGYIVFGNPNPDGISSVQCNHCGYSAAVNFERARKILQQRSTLA